MDLNSGIRYNHEFPKQIIDIKKNSLSLRPSFLFQISSVFAFLLRTLQNYVFVRLV